MKKFDGISDEKLIERLRGGDARVMDYLLTKYKPLVRSKAKDLFISGGDEDDLIQEGMIGLFKAIIEYDASKGASFYTFANICISGQIYNAIQKALSKKHQPLNTYVSFFAYNNSGELQIIDEIDSMEQENIADPEQIILQRENSRNIREMIAQLLSPLENRVMNLVLDGNDYREVAQKLGKTPKSIDNAIQRIKNKLLNSNLK